MEVCAPAGRHAPFEPVLGLEVRARREGKPDGGDEGESASFDSGRERREGGVEREPRADLEAFTRVEVATRASVIAVAAGRRELKPVGAAAQQHRDEEWTAGIGGGADDATGSGEEDRTREQRFPPSQVHSASGVHSATARRSASTSGAPSALPRTRPRASAEAAPMRSIMAPGSIQLDAVSG